MKKILFLTLASVTAGAMLMAGCDSGKMGTESGGDSLEGQPTTQSPYSPAPARLPGDQVQQVPLPVQGFGVSVAADCDGNVYYTNNGQLNLYVMDKDGNLLNTLPTVDAATGAALDFDEMAYDASRGVLWAQLHGSNPISIYHIDPATGVATHQWVSATNSLGSFRDGIAYDGSDDSIWLSGDVSTTIDHYQADGTYVGTITPKDAAGGTLGTISGIMVGVGDLMYLGRNGLTQIVQVKKSDGSFISSFASPGGTRDEGLECDPVNFPTLALWSRDVSNFMSVIEIEEGTCTCGGGVPRLEIDIKPGSCPNPLNTKDRGVVPVGIVGTESLDPTTEVDPASVTLAGVPVLKWEILDTTQPNDSQGEGCYDCFDADQHLNCDLDGDGVDDAYCGDGIPDLIVYFDAQALVAALGAVEDGDCVPLELAATLVDGQETGGSDSMLIRKKGNQP